MVSMRLTCGFLSSINEVILTRPVTHRILLKHTTPLQTQCNLHTDAKAMLVIISYFIEKGVLDSYIELIGEYTLQLRIKKFNLIIL